MYQNFGKQIVYWVLVSIVIVVISDYISSAFVKDFFKIPRPCRDSFLDPVANLRINRCPSSYSFTSSHAVNHFTIATFWFITLKPFVKWAIWFLLWAAIVCYAQVYVGVHYPIDVISGGLLGSFIGYTAGHIFNYKTNLTIKTVQQKL
jgi:membrane-associated phospholipid phosphatase